MYIVMLFSWAILLSFFIPSVIYEYQIANTDNIYILTLLTLNAYLEDLAMQIEDDLCIAPSSIHEVLKTVRDVNRTVVLPQEKLSDSAYIYRRDTHIISQAILKNPDDLTCEKNTKE